MAALKKPTGRPRKTPGTKTRDNTISFTLFLRREDHKRLKAEANRQKMALQYLIQNRALQGRADGERPANLGFRKAKNPKDEDAPLMVKQTVGAIRQIAWWAQPKELVKKALKPLLEAAQSLGIEVGSTNGVSGAVQLDVEVESLKSRIKELEAQVQTFQKDNEGLADDLKKSR